MAVVLEQIRRMLTEAKYVHGDLSPYNVLWLDEEPWIIDVAQAVPRDHARRSSSSTATFGILRRSSSGSGCTHRYLPAWDAIGGARLAPRRS